MPPGATDFKERQAAQEKWVTILGILKIHGAFGKKVGYLSMLVEECTAVKATSTLAGRAGSWALYLAWCKSQAVDPYPLEPFTVEGYLREAAKHSPSRGSRFLESVAFAGHVFGVQVDAAFTPRARGIAAKALCTRKEVRQASPFPAAMIQRWEKQLTEEAGKDQNKDVAQTVFLGHVLWTVHTRSRFGDSARIRVEPALDLDEDGHGFIESKAHAREYKTGYSTRKYGKALPVLGCATGVSGLHWAMAWLKLRERAGCDATRDQCLMPEILASGEFGAGRMRTTDANALLRSLVQGIEGADPGSYGTHSGKATLLSWVAKAGLPRSHRKLLGGHVDIADRTMVVYSRDALAEPVRALQELLRKVRSGEFKPDATRSGRWAQPDTAQLSGTESASGSNTDEDTSDSESEQDGKDEVVAAEVLGEKAGYPAMPDGGIWQCAGRSKLHRGTGASDWKTACGFVLELGTSTWSEEWRKEKQLLCRRSGCFPNGAAADQ